ncbi:MAG: hypothetical protein CME62_16600 [Halobacteriovoraceae bacterium]|nr:hypothetical protein [Halobacteriovoraceae bacterium]|tara:strand:+ start:8086 stop:8823 length:738 start_codon:yes stop_codon:yes gene_type:complete
MKAILLSFILILTSSCASYVQSIHRQIDNEKRGQANQKQRQYRAGYRPGQDRRPIQNPVTLNGVPTASKYRNYAPRVKRQYNSRGRTRAEDLRDNADDGSLWSGENSENFLFVTNNMKRKGDIVIIDVYDNLKDKIQDELKRNFPEPKKKTNAKAGEEEQAEQPEEAAPAVAGQNPEKVHDKISAKVIEIVNNDYIMLRGRKEVMFQERKRYFEIQAVVSQKDITANDTVESNKILEPRINVLRY